MKKYAWGILSNCFFKNYHRDDQTTRDEKMTEQKKQQLGLYQRSDEINFEYRGLSGSVSRHSVSC